MMLNTNLGRLVMTARISHDMENNQKFSDEINTFVKKFMQCDWGDICAEDKALNDEAFKSGEDRIVASYESSKGNIFIITEWDRSCTTILYAEEY